MIVKAEKLLERMRNNPRDWRIDDLKAIAARYDIEWRQPGTSHVTFSFKGQHTLTVPAHKPIKPVYVMKFLQMVYAMGGNND